MSSWNCCRKSAVTLGILSLLAWLPLTAFADGEGTTAAPFLKIGTSARAEAMGGAFTAVVNDVDSTYWNPAGLAQLKRSTLGFSHLEWFEGIRYEYLSYADKFDYLGAVGVNVGYFYLGDIPKTLELPTGDYDPASAGTFRASDLMVGLGWAGNMFWRENKVGVGIKVISEAIDTNQAFVAALDVGDQLLLSKARWYHKAAETSWMINLVPSVLGFSLKNLGTPIKYTTQNDSLPTTAQLGGRSAWQSEHAFGVPIFAVRSGRGMRIA